MMVNRKVLLRPFDMSIEDVERLSPSEYAELLKYVYEMCKEEIEDVFRKNPQAMELVICDGKVIHISKEPVSRETIERLVHEHEKPCFIISRPIPIEEARWTRLDDDYYPSIEVFLGGAEWPDGQVIERGVNVACDFDTGCPTYFLDERLGERFVVPPMVLEWRRGSHLNRSFIYFYREVKIGVRDEEGAVRCKRVNVAFIVDWHDSPFVLINPTRAGLIGRKIMFDLSMRVTLDPIRRVTITRLL